MGRTFKDQAKGARSLRASHRNSALYTGGEFGHGSEPDERIELSSPVCLANWDELEATPGEEGNLGQGGHSVLEDNQPS